MARSPGVWVGLLGLLHLLWLLDVLTGQRALFTRDALFFILPFKTQAAHALLDGHFPSLSQALMGGMPLWSHPSAEVADPATLFFALLPPWAALGWSSLVHGVVAGLGVFLLARRVSVGPLLAGWAALAYVGSGPVLSLWTIAAVPSVATPWVVLGGALMARGSRRHAWLVTALSVAFLLIHPDPPFVAGAALCSLAVCVARAPQGKRGRAVLSLAAAGVTGLLVAGAFLVPALAVVADSPRTALGAWSAASSLGWRWLEVLGAGALGVPGASGGLQSQAPHPEGLFLGSVYLGSSVVMALLLSRIPRARTDVAVVLTGAVLLVLAHGDALPGAAAFWSAVHARFPEKLVLPSLVCVILWAARNLQRLCNQPVVPAALWTMPALAVLLLLTAPTLAGVLALRPEGADLFAGQVTLGATLLLACSAGVIAAVRRRSPTAVGLVLLVATALEGTVAASVTLLSAPLDALRGDGFVALAQPGDGVLCCHLHQLLEEVPTASWPQAAPWTAASEDVRRLKPATAAIRGVRYPVAPDVGGFEPTEMRALMTFVLPALETGALLRLYARWGVDQVVSLEPVPGGTPVDRTPHPWLYVKQLEHPAARLEVHTDWRQTDSTAAAVRAVASGETSLALNALHALTLPTADRSAVLTDTTSTDSSAAGVVESPVPTMVLHTATLRDGWEARVDGVASDVVRANGIHMAVQVPAGHHTVAFSYAMPGARWGVLGSVVGIILLAWMARRR